MESSIYCHNAWYSFLFHFSALCPQEAFSLCDVLLRSFALLRLVIAAKRNMDISRIFLHSGCGYVYGNVRAAVRLNGMVIDIEKALFLLLKAQAGIPRPCGKQRDCCFKTAPDAGAGKINPSGTVMLVIWLRTVFDFSGIAQVGGLK